ncbi:LOW QUALITY PROTEIN: dynein axonemal heavy chain 2 [Salvelinus alpinus]
MADPETPRSGKSSGKSKRSSSGKSKKAKNQSITPAPEESLPEDKETQPGEEIQEESSQGTAVTVEEVDTYTVGLRTLFKNRVALTGMSKLPWSEENEKALDKFIMDSSNRTLVVYPDPYDGLRVEYAMPSQVVDQLAFFVRSDGGLILEETFESTVQFGTVRGNATESLLRMMNGVHAPQVTLSTAWPESIKNNYSAHMHRFLTNLTDTRFKLVGNTVLYIPMEALQHSPEVASKDKELVQRLEMVMIHWTRQIKEVLNAQETVETGDSSGPLEEISFWRSRCADLSGISQQLQKPGVRHVLTTLQLSKSSYVPPFCKLAKQIQDGSLQAQSNLSFLSLLREPCEEMAQLKPREVVPKLAHILNLIRLIWVNSVYYNTRERLTALFRKMSNEIIRLCCRDISLDRIFQGYVVSSKQTLNDCIQCCLAWKELYLHASQLHHKYSSKGWVLDQTSIFALVDAFVQRCKDLLEVCDCQQQFARREEGEQIPLPSFAGRQGAEVTRSLLEMESTFGRSLMILQHVRKGILDVKNTSWHDDYNRFRAGVKDLEVMMQNLISTAFETVNTVDEGVQLLDVFQHLCREAIKRTIDRKTVDVYGLFNKELNLVNKELSKKVLHTPAHMPLHAGQAHWARALRRRIERPMEVVQCAHFMPHIGSGEEVRLAYSQLVQTLDELVRRVFSEWSQSLDRQSLKRLDQPLMMRCKEKQGMLDINFDKNMLKMFNEIHYWERLLFEIPHYVSDVYQRREELRSMRESVLLVVRDYNRIIASLSAEELGLFRERLRFLDKKIQPGLSKLLWSSKGASSFFIKDCRLHASKIQLIVDEYKAANLAISRQCGLISELLLVRVDGKTVYRDLEFEGDQQAHQQAQLQRLHSAHQDIVAIMSRVYETFRTDGPEVQQHWVVYTEKMDGLVEEALRLNIKWSLQELSKAINGDSKTSPNPLFRVQVVLRHEGPGATSQVEFSPTLQKLAQIVNNISCQLIGTISVVKRLPDLLTRRRSQRTVRCIIEQDEEIGKIQAAVAAGMTANAGHLQAYLKTWDKHREIWEINKDPFIRRYQRLNPPVSSFDADIARYTEVANNVQKEETVLSVQFVLLDCAPLKFSLVQHCNEWQGKFTQLLSLMASTRLKELHVFLQENALRLSQSPQSLVELGESLKLLETLQGDLQKIESQIPPIHEQFAILEKYEVTVDQAVHEMLEALNGEWVWFQQVVIDSDIMLKKNKDKFKSSLIFSAEEFKKKMQTTVQTFSSSGPFGSVVTCELALEKVAALRGQLDTLKEEEGTIRHGLGIFKLEQPCSKDVQTLEKDLDYLQQVWEITQQWDAHWDEWKEGQFVTLQTESMENTAQAMFKKLHKLSRELKDKQWEIVDFSKNRIDQFKRTIPLISDLRNPAMRDRHWKQICHEVQRSFDHTSPEFTLERIVALGLEQHADKISEISGAASKELSIEQSLEGIAMTWEETSLDIAPYKDKGHHRLRGTEEVFQTLEDNQVTLSTMKASRFVRAFEKEVDHWERCLSLVLEVIEVVLTVQRQWMYLENIFLGEDIRKQLPRESTEFDDINSSWKTIMDRLNKDNNALRGTHHPGLPEKLSEMNNKLEEIQKSLDMYLETKRQIFPRFYFLSNDDLLEILGQSRHPEAVQPHLKKCFDNIKSLRMGKVGISSAKSEASGMFSAEGEFVEFSHPVLLEGPVEAWLCDVERTMRWTLKDSLKNCRLALKKMTGKRDKWVKDWPGQMLITASQIQWTADVTKSLITGKERADKSALKSLKKKQVSMLHRYSDAIRGNLSKILRQIVALVTVEVHDRDVIDKLAKTGCNDVNAFDWLCQLRLYWEKEVDDCIIRQTNTHFQYSYEYLGNSGRLVITPLTDRCYMTLTTALHLHRGGSPKGPAGTGKTETVKDLGKAMGMYVIVVNCSDGMDFKSMGRMYSGLAQTGAWGCFDEFNRINIEVLSVVAQQILSILSALSAGATSFIFEGREIRLVWSCGIFITMNPGYAGRTELPDNLKSMFRPISMVVPDSTLIAEITLFGEGFNNCKLLAKKVFTLYSLAVQQLSKQDHYDFGLRALTSLLRYAGKKRRVCPDVADEEILLMSMKDMNIAKLASVDLPLFNGIIQDLFPAVETPTIDYGKLRETIEAELQQACLQVTPFTLTKVIQLYETKNSRHSTMIVGKTGSGKTVTWRTLQSTLTTMHRKGEPGFNLVRECPLNPKAVSLGELYGEYDLSTNEWTDGVLSSLMRGACAESPIKHIYESQIKRIYGTMINQKLQEFEEEVKPIGSVLTQATLELYYSTVARFLPTPAKIHYLFNLRDISRVFQGLLRAHRDFHDTKQSITRLWIHECFRVFSDRLVDQSDTEAFVGLLAEKLGSLFELTYHSICPNKQPPIFGDFLKEPRVYEDLVDFKTLKGFMDSQLEDYNLTPGVVPMSLVLFRDAIEHVTRVVRVISQPRGNMLLVGIGGSGRQSLSKMAASICEYLVFQVEVTKQYRKQEFREDIKKLYRLTGVDNKPTVFLFNDTQIVDQSFLEDINNILSSGEVPNLYKQDEFEEVSSALSDCARKENIIETPDSMFNYLIERVRNNLHIVLCMSPVGDPFRNYIRQYPALVNCATIDWFSEWPRDALLEVAERYLDGLALGTVEGIQTKVASIFVTMHQSVAQFSQRMKLELKRHNYVTPTNYLELVSGYKKLLAEKRSELGEQVSKLRNGLFKIDDTRSKVEAMSVELEEAKKKVADFQKQCEEYLVIIVQQKREADEQQKTVSAHSEKIGAEEIKCRAMAENAQRDLDEAVPALEEAMKALESLNKKDMTEIKSYGRPPTLVETVMQAVMILRGNEPTWAEAKRQLGEGNFIKQLVHFDKDNISDRVLKKIGQYCTQPDFHPEIIGRVSLAAKSLCMWVRAMEVYGRIFRVVEPKRARLNGAMSQLAEKQASLAEAQAKLIEVGEKLDLLKRQYDEKLAQKEELRRKSEDMEIKLDRAGKLVSGLAGERIRWEETVVGLETNMGFLVGDCLLAAAFLSYMGPFLSNYRDQLVSIWMKQVRELEVPCSPGFSFAVFLSKPTAVRDWNIQGLPSDAFSTENGVIVTRGNRWPLMVDPQGQALKWVKSMEMKRGLKVIDLQMPDFLRVLENAVQFGSPVLLQNVQEELDPSLAPILNKSLTHVGGRLLLKLGDKEVEYSPEFRFYITTKLSNPHYTPEISTKTTIVNFAVKEQGLEAQLLGIVVRKERPELEEQKDSLVINIASGKRKLQELEDEILRLLNEATGSLLDDVQLVNTLQTSKVTATEVSEQLETSELTEIKIDTAREAYRPCAQRASILFFVLNDMGRIDPMYQFNLDAYIDLFNLSIEKSQRTQKLDERIANLNDYHTYAVYRYTCRGLFEVHKLLFSFQICAKILEVAGKLNMDEYSFFLRGGLVLDKESQMENPCSSWLAESNWDNVTELDKLANFHGLMASFEQYPRDWTIWYTSAGPETAQLPGEWENGCNELQRMLIVRSLRQDRVAFCVAAFIINNLGSRFVEPPVLDMKAVVEDSTTKTPLIFVLSPGVDPTGALLQLAEASGMSRKFHALSLGQGQAPIATRMIKEGVKSGHWVFLANCHLCLSWMPQLDKLVELLQVEEPHPDFRLWLSSSPHPDFPIAILQAGIKMTTEPPRGVKSNMKRLYQLVTEGQFTRCARPVLYRKLLFALCFFHSILLERKKFLQLGWNIIYGFNDSDFEVSESLMSLYLDEYEEIPWDALKYLIAGVNYGGHVTDDFDRRLLTTYINDYFCEAAVAAPFFKLSSLSTYYIPRDGPQSSYREYISHLPATEHPEVFGQHPNADIASQIAETRTLFDTLLSLQPQVTSGATAGAAAGTSRENKVLELAADVLQKIPGLIDYEGTRVLLADDPSPLNVVLLQEIQRYNALLHTIRSSLIELEKGIKGLVVMSSSLEETFHCIFDARVPPLWVKAYPSLKPLASWTRDLCQRVEQFARWAETAHPPTLFWLSGFTFPTGFLTAVLQSSARQHSVSVDTLSWEFIVATVDDNNLLFPPKDGVFIRGLYLEGAGWDKKNSCLVEAKPMQLVCPIPTIHFKPVENRKKIAKSMYLCPCYYFPVRSGDGGRPSFVVGVDLKSGDVPFDHWIKRGTALLMSLDN